MNSEWLFSRLGPLSARKAPEATPQFDFTSLREAAGKPLDDPTRVRWERIGPTPAGLVPPTQEEWQRLLEERKGTQPGDPA